MSDENELKRWLTEEEWKWYSERGREVVSRKVTIFGVFCQSLAAARRDLSLAEQREVELREVIRVTAIRAFTSGRESGHNATVEGGYIPVHQSDERTYFEDRIDEMLADGSLPEAVAALSPSTPPPPTTEQGSWQCPKCRKWQSTEHGHCVSGYDTGFHCDGRREPPPPPPTTEHIACGPWHVCTEPQPQPEQQGMEDENLRLRKLLAVVYSGTPNLYGDDGCLQDNRRRPPIDYIKDSAEEIERKMQERGRAAIVPPPQQQPTTEQQPVKCKCGGDMLPWNGSLVYRDAEDKVELRCFSCGAKRPFPPQQPPCVEPAAEGPTNTQENQ